MLEESKVKCSFQRDQGQKATAGKDVVLVSLVHYSGTGKSFYIL